ncbi:MAG TPA: hypothetical protein DCY89_00480 [Gammaproteobacteria bacterium]|nr:hypothetical protein [Gammaproteobacteria bacterium]
MPARSHCRAIMKLTLPPGMRSPTGLLVALLLLALLATVWFKPTFLLGDGQAVAEQEREALLAEGRGFVQRPAETIALLRAELAAIAALDDVRTSLAAPAETREALAARLGAGLKNVRVLRILQPGHYELDVRKNPPLTYAALELLRSAEVSGRSPPVELVAAGTPDEHLLMVERVTDAEGKLLGFLQVAWDTVVVQGWAAALAERRGYEEIRQPIPGAPPVVLLRDGGLGAPSSTEPVLLPISDSRLLLVLWPANALPLGATPLPSGDLVWVLGLAGLVLFAVLLALWRVRQGSPRQPVSRGQSVVFDGAVRAVLSGRHPGLERLLPALPAGVRVEPPADAPHPPERDARPAEAPALFKPDLALDGSSPEAVADLASSVVQGMHEHLADTGLTIDFSDFESTTQEFAATADAGSMATAEEEVERVPRSLFRAYDIRGIAGEELTEDVAYAIGRALGSEAEVRGQSSVVVARDGRLSSPELTQAVIEGLMDTGREVIDIGLAPSPVLYFATHYLDTRTGIMVTGSHNPAEWNGFKLVLDGETLSGAAVEGLRLRINRGEYHTGKGRRVQANMLPEYIRRVSEDIPVALTRPFNIVVDAGNSVAGLVAPPLLRALGHDVVELNCEVDGNFPSHDPDPSQAENLLELQGRVMAEDADFGLAFDGDGDRLGFVAENGEIVWADQLLMLLARDVLTRCPGAPVLFDVKCSRALERVVSAAGGRPVMTRTGHSFIRAEMKALDAPLGGELSGHIFVGERWYGFDDAFYAAARLIEVLMAMPGPASQVFASLPTAYTTPELRVALPTDAPAGIMAKVLARASELDGEPVTLDGLRVNYPDGWGLVRASTTSAGLVLRFEGDTPEALARIETRFRDFLKAIEPTLDLPPSS